MRKALTLYVFALLLNACANIGSLGGGPADEQAPVLLNTNLTDIRFNEKEIVLEFNEFITLNSPEKNILLLPADSKLKFVLLGKTLRIKITDSLKSNTTYSLNINKGILDNNAGNPFVWSTVFSTGSVKDSHYIRIRTLNPYDYKQLKLSIVQSGSPVDSFKAFKPSYTLEADKSSLAEFKGLKPHNFDIWLYTDLNADNKPDFYQPLQFLINAKTDTQYTLEPQNWYKPFALIKIKRDKNFTKVYYNSTLDPSAVPSGLGLPFNTFLYYNSDSAVFANTNNFNHNIPVDTVFDLNSSKDLINQISTSLKILYDGKRYHTFYSLPQAYYTHNKANSYVEQYLSSEKKPEYLTFKNHQTDNTDTVYIDSKNTLKSDGKAFIDITIKSKDSLLYEMCILNLEEKEIIYKNGINAYKNFIDPGEYKIRIRPMNARVNFDPFSHRNISPVIYEKTMYLKGSWEEILLIHL